MFWLTARIQFFLYDLVCFKAPRWTHFYGKSSFFLFQSQCFASCMWLWVFRYKDRLFQLGSHVQDFFLLKTLMIRQRDNNRENRGLSTFFYMSPRTLPPKSNGKEFNLDHRTVPPKSLLPCLSWIYFLFFFFSFGLNVTFLALLYLYFAFLHLYFLVCLLLSL